MIKQMNEETKTKRNFILRSTEIEEEEDDENDDKMLRVQDATHFASFIIYKAF